MSLCLQRKSRIAFRFFKMGNEESNTKQKSFSTSILTADDVEPLDVSDVSDESEYSDFFEDDSMYNLAGYEFVKKLGSGASGTVIEMSKDGTNYAVKVCSLKNTQLNFLSSTSHDPKEEAVVMKRLNNPNIVKVIDFIEDVDNSLIYIVMELMTGGSIGKCKTLQEKRRAFSQVLTALQYLHNQRLAHRDIKVENVMLDSDGNAKLCDFGVSVYVPIDQKMIKTKFIGTPAYCAPEIFDSETYDPFKADIWAFGVTLFILSFHMLPFVASNITKLREAIVNQQPQFPDGVDPQLVDLISKMLIKNPEDRITIEQIWLHPWASDLRPPFAGIMFQCANNFIQFSEANTKDVITRINRGQLGMVRKKKEKQSKKHKLIHGFFKISKKRRKSKAKTD